MKLIEKTTRDGIPQYFEVLQSRKELQEHIRFSAIYDALHPDWGTGTWDDEDSTLCFYTKSGEFVWYGDGEKVEIWPNVRDIERFISTNGNSVVIYKNLPIVYNEDEGYWQVEFDL